MNVVIEESKTSNPTLHRGDIVIHKNGNVGLVAQKLFDESMFTVVSITDATVFSSLSFCTDDEWIGFWEDEALDYTIYPASEYELVLRKRGS